MCGRLILHFVPTKLRNIEEERAKDSDFFNVYYAGESTFLLSWDKRKDTKRKITESPYVRHPQASLRLLSLKRAFQGCTSGATPVLPFADGARTRFAQTDRPLPAPDSTYAHAPTVRPGDHAAYSGMELIVFWWGGEVNTNFRNAILINWLYLHLDYKKQITNH